MLMKTSSGHGETALPAALQPKQAAQGCGDRGLCSLALGPLPYQVGSGRRALGAFLGGIVEARTEIGAGHSAPIEGPEDADGGFARADDEELLSIAGVDSVVPQHLAQVPWKGKAGVALSRGDTKATGVGALGSPKCWWQ